MIEEGRELAGRGIAFHDLTGLFAGHPEPLYWDSCCHYNLEGNRLLGEAIGRAAAQALKVPNPAAARGGGSRRPAPPADARGAPGPAGGAPGS